MAETTADVRRDIELTRDRISNTLNQLEQKVQVTQIIRDHPWPAVGLALGAGFLLSGSSVDVKASATTLAATKGASSRLGTVLDEMVASLMGGLSGAFEQKLEQLVNELKGAIGAPLTGSNGAPHHTAHAGQPDIAGGMALASSGNAGAASTGSASSGLSGGAGGYGAASGGVGSSTSASGYQTRAD